MNFRRFFKAYSSQEKELAAAVKNITGRAPRNISLFHLAMQHASVGKVIGKNGFRESNERLEYLGDAILGAIVADYLFKKYPYQNEGFLTEIRSRIVSRVSLNDLARKIGLDQMVNFDSKKSPAAYKSMYGDAMEAFVGAVYLDRGYGFCKKFIVNKLLHTYLDLETVVNSNNNYKSQLIEWSQRHNKSVKFKTISEKGKSHHKQFKVQVLLDTEQVSKGTGFSKKKAEQDAARRACEFLGVTEE